MITFVSDTKLNKFFKFDILCLGDKRKSYSLYLDSNYHGDASYPQMIICGESRDHNIKIAEYLRANGMWSEENTILFTEDLLNMKRSLVSIYALADDNTQNWYALPERKESFREAA